MAALDIKGRLVGNVTGWYRPESFANVADGSTPTIWPDSSGQGPVGGIDRDLVFSASGAVVKHDQINGYSVVDFDGVAGYLDSGAIAASSFLTAANAFAAFAAKVRTIPSDNSDPALNAPVWGMNSPSGCGVYFRTSVGAVHFNDDGTNDVVNRAIAAGVWFVDFWEHAGGDIYGSVLGDHLIPGTTAVSGATTNLATKILIGKNHEATPKFLDCQIAEILFCDVGFRGNAARIQDAQIILNYFMAKYAGRGDAQGQAIRVGSAWLYEHREPRLLITVPDLPQRALDLDLGDEFGLAHPLVPHPSGKGTGPRPWELLPLRIVAAKADFNRRLVELVGEYKRTCLFSASAMAGVIPGQGLAVTAINPGPMFLKRVVPSGTVAGDGFAHVARSADDLVYLLPEGAIKLSLKGVLCEIDARQHIQDSVFFTGGEEWTLVNPTGGTVAYVLTATVGKRVFDEAVTTRCIEFTRGTSGTGTAAPPLLALTANADGSEFAMFQIDVKGILAGANYRIQNASGNYWDNATKAWVAGITDNAITDPGDGQYVSNPIPILAAISSFTVRQDTGVGSAGDKFQMFYGGLVRDGLPGTTKPRLRWPCSRQVLNVTTAEAWMGQDYGPLWPNYTGKRNLLSELGAVLTRVEPNWNTADVVNVDSTALKFTLFSAYYDSNNWIWLHYYRDSGGGVAEFRLDVKAAGTVYRASLSYTVTRGQVLSVWGRWTSAAGGELDKPARTLTVGVEDQVSADAQAAVLPTSTNIAFIGIGAMAGPIPTHYELPLCGYWKNCDILPTAPPDDVMKAWRF